MWDEGSARSAEVEERSLSAIRRADVSNCDVEEVSAGSESSLSVVRRADISNGDGEEDSAGSSKNINHQRKMDRKETIPDDLRRSRPLGRTLLRFVRF